MADVNQDDSVLDPWNPTHSPDDTLKSIKFSPSLPTNDTHETEHQTGMDKVEQDFKQLSVMLNGSRRDKKSPTPSILSIDPGGRDTPRTMSPPPLSASSLDGTYNLDDLDLEDFLTQFSTLNEFQRRDRIGPIFMRSCTSGNAQRVQMLLKKYGDYIDINKQDDDGTTALIYASCFGHLEVVYLLLESGASVDIQDKYGWTALMWASNNNHEGIMRLLIDFGASQEPRTKQGRTVRDFLNHSPTPLQSAKLVHILDSSKNSSKSSLVSVKSGAASAGIAGAGLSGASAGEFYFPGLDLDPDLVLGSKNAGSKAAVELDKILDKEKDREDMVSAEPFVWDKCLPEQMLVFDERRLDHIIDVVVTNMKPGRTMAEKPVPANVIFLTARYAHYFASETLLDELLTKAVGRIEQVTKANPTDMCLLAFWLANCTQLLYYLKKDTSLVLAGAPYQAQLSELIQEVYQTFVQCSMDRLDPILVPAILDHDSMPGFDKLHLDYPSTVTPAPTFGATVAKASPKMKKNTITTSSSPSPKTVITVLNSITFLLQLYDVHPSLISQALTQLFHYINTVLLSTITSTPKYCNRFKGMAIRMNLSVVEEWVRRICDPSSLDTKMAGPVEILPVKKDQFLNQVSICVELCQLLQVATAVFGVSPTPMSPTSSLESTFKDLHATQFSHIPYSAILRTLKNYAYEKGEPRVDPKLFSYLEDVAHPQEQMEVARGWLPFWIPKGENEENRWLGKVGVTVPEDVVRLLN